MSSASPTQSGLQAYQRVGALETVSYSLGDVGFNLYWAPLTAFLMIYLTDVVGLSVATVGGLIVTMRITSAIADPVFAALADRTHTAYGRYRPWFLWLALPLAAAGFMAFSSAGFPQHSRVIAVYVSFCLLNLIYTAIMAPYNALSGALTPDARQREYLMSVRFGTGFLATVFLTWLTPKLVSYAGPTDQALGWQFAMTIFGVIAAGIFINLFLHTHERFAPQSPPHPNPLRDVADLFGNRPWLALCALSFIVMIALALHTGVAPYYVKYYIGPYYEGDLVTGFAMLFSLGLAVGAALTSTFTRWVGRRTLIAAALGLVAASGLVLFVAPPSLLILILLSQLLTGIALGAIAAITMVMYADAADLNAWRTGHSATAMTYSLIMVARKIGAALAMALITWVLSAHDYTANTTATPAMLDQIRLLIGLVPAIMAVVGTGVICLYDLTTDQVVRVQAEIAIGMNAKPN